MITGKNKYHVSVILTLYNSRKFYKRSFNSILNQSFKDFEIIITDDGSTDDIETELFPEIKGKCNIKYLRHSNRKQPLTLNSGILISTGDFITFLDADDEYKPDHLSDRVNYFKNNNGIDLIHTGAEIIGSKEDMYIPDVNDKSKIIHVKDCIKLGTLFGKRKVFLELEGFREIYSHDSDFFKRADNKYSTGYLESSSYIYYRNNPESFLSKLKKSVYNP